MLDSSHPSLLFRAVGFRSVPFSLLGEGGGFRSSGASLSPFLSLYVIVTKAVGRLEMPKAFRFVYFAHDGGLLPAS